MEDDIDILEKLEEKMRSILSLRLKIKIAEAYEDVDAETYLEPRLEELIFDIEDCFEVALSDICLDIEAIYFDEETKADVEEEPWMVGQ